MAHTLDEYLEFDAWKAVSEDKFYDWKLVNKVRRSLRVLREKNDVRGLLGVLEMCVRDNFGGVESARYFTNLRNQIGPYLVISYLGRLYSEVRCGMWRVSKWKLTWYRRPSTGRNS